MWAFVLVVSDRGVGAVFEEEGDGLRLAHEGSAEDGSAPVRVFLVDHREGSVPQQLRQHLNCAADSSLGEGRRVVCIQHVHLDIAEVGGGALEPGVSHAGAHLPSAAAPALHRPFVVRDANQLPHVLELIVERELEDLDLLLVVQLLPLPLLLLPLLQPLLLLSDKRRIFLLELPLSLSPLFFLCLPLFPLFLQLCLQLRILLRLLFLRQFRRLGYRFLPCRCLAGPCCFRASLCSSRLGCTRLRCNGFCSYLWCGCPCWLGSSLGGRGGRRFRSGRLGRWLGCWLGRCGCRLWRHYLIW